MKISRIILIIMLTCFLMISCQKRISTISEEEIVEYTKMNDINLLSFNVSEEEYAVLLCESNDEYYVDYCQKNEKSNITQVSRYNWEKNDDSFTAKVFGTNKCDYIIIILQEECLINETAKIHIKVDDINYDYILKENDTNCFIIQLPERPTTLVDPYIELFNIEDEILVNNTN